MQNHQRYIENTADVTIAHKATIQQKTEPLMIIVCISGINVNTADKFTSVQWNNT
jgi:hypothetical protein